MIQGGKNGLVHIGGRRVSHRIVRSLGSPMARVAPRKEKLPGVHAHDAQGGSVPKQIDKGRVAHKRMTTNPMLQAGAPGG